MSATEDRNIVPRGLLPNLIIIGGQKCGTSSLHFYLDKHPDVSMSRLKEPEYFIEERNWSRGLDWYRSCFRAASIRGEASANYSACKRFPGVPARAFEAVPDARLIYLMRDPLNRVVSHWIHNFAAGVESRPIREAVRHDTYVERSRYWMQLQAFLQHFSPEQVLIVQSERLRRNRTEVLREIFTFLEIDPDFWHPRFRLARHLSSIKRRRTPLGQRLADTGLLRRIEALPQPWRWQLKYMVFFPFSRPIKRPELDPSTRDWLVERLRDDVAELRAFSGMEFAGWSV